jgi:hypothetical protein
MKDILLLLKDTESHNNYNNRILEYLDDRHEYINKNLYRINIDLITSNNLDHYVKKGVESIPALFLNENDISHGVSSILSKLAKLEFNNQPQQPVQVIKQSKRQEEDEAYQNYTSLALKEMLDINGQEGDDTITQSTVKIKNQSIEPAINGNEIDDQCREKFGHILKQRNLQTKNAGKPIAKGMKISKEDLTEKNLEENLKSYDTGENYLMNTILNDMGHD